MKPKRKNHFQWIGLTGGLASGKSTVSGILKQKNIPVVDADEIAHQVLRPDGEAYAEVVRVFGPGFVNSDGDIDRRKLGQHIFADSSRREKLESIIHPLVQQKVLQFKLQCEKRGDVFAIYDVPLLFEKNLQSQFDGVLLVSCSEALQIQRMRQRNQWSDQEIHDRLKAQIPLAQKEKKSTWVLQNNSSLEDLKMSVFDWIEKLK